MIKTITQENYLEELRPYRAAVVKVHESWCGPCRFMKAVFEKWSDKHTKLFGQYEVGYFEILHDANPEFAEKFDAHALPTLLFFVHGILMFKIEGICQEKTFCETLNNTLMNSQVEEV